MNALLNIAGAIKKFVRTSGEGGEMDHVRVSRQTARGRRVVNEDGTMIGTFPYRCSTCGVVCETVEELTDPAHHEG